MYPVLANITNTTANYTIASNAVLVGVVDPYTVLVLMIIGLVLLVVGVFARGAIIAFIAFILLLITGVVYAGGFAVYDPSTGKLVIYQSHPLAFLFITFSIIAVAIGIYKVLTYPRMR